MPAGGANFFDDEAEEGEFEEVEESGEDEFVEAPIPSSKTQSKNVKKTDSQSEEDLDEQEFNEMDDDAEFGEDEMSEEDN